MCAPINYKFSDDYGLVSLNVYKSFQHDVLLRLSGAGGMHFRINIFDV